MTPIPAPTPTPRAGQSIRVPVLWGLAFGAIQAASPLALWWLDQATVQALLLALIAAVYIGFAVADGRPKVIAVESSIAGAFVLLAAAGVTGPAAPVARLRCAEEDDRHLGEQVRPAARDLAQLGDSGLNGLLVGRLPASVMLVTKIVPGADPDRLLLAEITGEARHRARWRPLTDEEEATALAELR